MYTGKEGDRGGVIRFPFSPEAVGEPVMLACSCCGEPLRNTPEENVSFGEVPYPHDEGYGLCVECGGDRSSKDVKTRLGWQGRTFYEARFDTIRRGLTGKNRTLWDAMSYEKKMFFVNLLIERGLLF